MMGDGGGLPCSWKLSNAIMPLMAKVAKQLVAVRSVNFQQNSCKLLSVQSQSIDAGA